MMKRNLATMVAIFTSAFAGVSHAFGQAAQQIRQLSQAIGVSRGGPLRGSNSILPRHKRKGTRPKPGKPGRRPKYRPNQRSGRRRGQ